jgi:hypothetical protein
MPTSGGGGGGVGGGVGVGGGGGGGGGGSIDADFHALPPDSVTLISWCKGNPVKRVDFFRPVKYSIHPHYSPSLPLAAAIICTVPPAPPRAFYAAVGVRCPSLHEWARDFVLNPLCWSGDVDDVAAAARDACVIELLNIVHGNGEEISNLLTVLKGEFGSVSFCQILVFVVLFNPHPPLPSPDNSSIRCEDGSLRPPPMVRLYSEAKASAQHFTTEQRPFCCFAPLAFVTHTHQLTQSSGFKSARQATFVFFWQTSSSVSRENVLES